MVISSSFHLFQLLLCRMFYLFVGVCVCHNVSVHVDVDVDVVGMPSLSALSTSPLYNLIFKYVILLLMELSVWFNVAPFVIQLSRSLSLSLALSISLIQTHNILN